MKKDKKRFSLFRYPLDGKGVSKDVDEKRNFTFFFKLLGRKFSTLISVNMLLLFGNFPIFLLIVAMSGVVNSTSYAPASYLFGPVYGVAKIAGENEPLSRALLGAHGVQIEMSVNTTATYVLFFVGFAMLLLTFGVTVAGTSYILRNAVKGDPIFLMQDFFRTIKNNWKQALPFGAADLIFCLLSVFNIRFYAANRGTYIVSVMFFLSIAIAMIYFVMRFYVYVMMVTFRLSLFKLLKNSLIFSIIGFKRNILGVLGIAAVVALNYTIAYIFPPLGFLLPFVMTSAICQFIAIYTSWPKIYEIMVEPDENKDEGNENEERPVFRDDVTDREKLKKLKQSK